MGESEEHVQSVSRRSTRLIRLPEVVHRVGLGRSTIYRWIAEGRFPKPVQLGGHTVAWPEDEVENWIFAHLKQTFHTSATGS